MPSLDPSEGVCRMTWKGTQPELEAKHGSYGEQPEETRGANPLRASGKEDGRKG